MMSCLRLSLVRLLLWFIAGIILYRLAALPGVLSLIPPFILLFSFIGLFCLVFYGHLSYSRRWIPGALIALFYLLCGYLLAFADHPVNHPLNLIHRKDPVSVCIGTVTEPPRPGKSTIRLTLSLISVRGQDQWSRAEGKVIVYAKKNSPLPDLSYGDTLMVTAGLRPVSGPKNPGQFDYRKYLERNGIYHQSYLTPGSVQVMGHMKKWTVKRFAFLVHLQLAGMLHESGLEERERATAQALLLGDKSQIDEETYQAYSSSGTIHILCVSGLHVGVIYLILDFLLGFLPANKTAGWARYLLIILLIWFYALLTGLSPSVLRATVMFTILILGRAFRRSTNIYNTLASSALLLLAANTRMLMDTGFQLSYLAVIGIVSLQPWIRDLLPVKGWLVKKIWELMSVSLAAQLLTLPLTLFLFHKFPNYFLIANVLVVPLSGFIIYAGILVFTTHPVPFLWKLMCWIFGWMVRGMNETVSFIERLPYSTLTALPMDAAEMVLLYIVIFTATIWLVFRQKRALFFLLAALVVTSGYKLWLLQQGKDQKELVVYSVTGTTAIGLIHERKGVFILDSALYRDPSRINMHLKGHWVKRRIHQPRLLPLTDTQLPGNLFVRSYKMDHLSLYYLGDKGIMVVDTKLQIGKIQGGSVQVSCILLRNNARVSLKEVIKVVDAECIIADNSNSRWRVNKWKTEAAAAGVCFYDTSEEGAFVKRWK